MMLPLDTLHRVVRTRVCRNCLHRTSGWDTFGPGVARPCETECELFNSLPALLKTARLVDPLLTDPRRAMRQTLDRRKSRRKECTVAHGVDTGQVPANTRRQEETVIDAIDELLHR